MRVRVRFYKQEPLQYIGHLDVMRYFQKAVRRAGLPVKFSGGFSPHILITFASPLGVGKISRSEYFDLDLSEYVPCEEILARLHSVTVPALGVSDAAYVEESKKANGMRVIAAASYRITWPGSGNGISDEQISRFLEQKEIPVMRRTKKKTEMTDIRPWIYSLEKTNGGLSMLLSAGSIRNLKPELVLEALEEMAGIHFPDPGVRICREELYASREQGDETHLVSLLDCDRLQEGQVTG